jgi:hypothetical protein
MAQFYTVKVLTHTFCVRCYYEDFKTAVNKYVQGLEYRIEEFEKVNDNLIISIANSLSWLICY